MLSSLMITFQKDGSQILEQDIPVCKKGRRLGEDLHVKWVQKEFAIVFSKVNAVRKDHRSGSSLSKVESS